MKREIKFKAKQLGINDWVEGDLIHHKDKCYISIQNVGHNVVANVPIDVDPDTVCQFTGFVDSNGQDIYENDILEHIKYPNAKLCIEWLENRYVPRKVSGEVKTYSLVTPGFLKNYIVIGSKFDGRYKELLQEYRGYSLYEPSNPNTRMTLADFIEGCESGCLIDDDGIGYYGTETKESDLEICPSDVTDGDYRTDFTHVYWYNK